MTSPDTIPQDAVKQVKATRPAPQLLSDAEKKGLLSDAERLWERLQKDDLGGYSGHNRPFYILHAFKEAIEKYGRRDVGLTWSQNDIDALAPATVESEPVAWMWLDAGKRVRTAPHDKTMTADMVSFLAAAPLYTSPPKAVTVTDERIAKAAEKKLGLCEDCPPSGYPTDKTRCLPCPRREHPVVVTDAMVAAARRAYVASCLRGPKEPMRDALEAALSKPEGTADK